MADEEDDGEEKPKSGAMGLIIAMVLLTVIGGGLGAGFGMYLADANKSQVAANEEKDKAKKEEMAKAEEEEKAKKKDKGKEGDEAEGEAEDVASNPIDSSVVVPLRPVVSNLADGERTWIRLEASVALIEIGEQDKDVVLAQITEDILAFVRSLTLEQLEGSAGFEHLHEDLSDLIKTRTKSDANRLIITGLIVE